MTERNYYALTIWEMDLSIVLKLCDHEFFEELIMQEEITKNNKRHFQAGIRFKKRIPYSSFKKWALIQMKNQISVRCEDTKDNTLNTWKRCVNYCSGNSGSGLIKCHNLENRYRILSDKKPQKIETSKEGIILWNKNHPVQHDIILTSDWSKEQIINQLKNNIEECKRYILRFD